MTTTKKKKNIHTHSHAHTMKYACIMLINDDHDDIEYQWMTMRSFVEI